MPEQIAEKHPIILINIMAIVLIVDSYMTESNELPPKKHFQPECDILEDCTKVRDIACYLLPRRDKIVKEVLRQMKVRYRKRQSSIDSAIRKQRRLSLGNVTKRKMVTLI